MLLDLDLDREGVTEAAEVAKRSDLSALDFQRAKERFAVFEDEIQKMHLEAKVFEVKDDRSAQAATALVGSVSKVVKRIEAERKRIVGPADMFVRAVNAFVKVFRDILQETERVLKKKIGDFAYQKELERRENERNLQEAARKQQEELDRLADEKKVERITIAQPVLPEKKEPIRAEGVSASTRMVWDYEVIDLESVPRSYLMINKQAVVLAIKGGIREISGIRIFEKPAVTVRGL